MLGQLEDLNEISKEIEQMQKAFFKNNSENYSDFSQKDMITNGSSNTEKTIE